MPGSAGAVEQLPLLPICQTEGGAGADEGSPGGGVRGRPPGSRNKSTAEWKAFFLSQHESPLMVMGRIMSADLHALAAEMGFTSGMRKATPDELLELFKVKLQCAKELLPYVHQKQPVAVENTGNGLMQLVINTGGVVSPESVGDIPAMPINFIDAKIESEQWVSDHEKANSDNQNSDNAENDFINQDDSAEKQTDLESVGLAQDGGADE